MQDSMPSCYACRRGAAAQHTQVHLCRSGYAFVPLLQQAKLLAWALLVQPASLGSQLTGEPKAHECLQGAVT